MTESNHLRIYLAGKIAKGSEVGEAPDWRDEYIEEIASIGTFEFLSPDDPTLDERFPQQIFGHDCFLVSQCDILVINAHTKLGAGTAQEMIIAKYFDKYVLSVVPRDSHHRRSNLNMHGIVVTDWIHPFIHQTSDHIVDSLGHLKHYLRDDGAQLRQRPPKGIKVVDEGIAAYVDSGHGRISQ